LNAALFFQHACGMITSTCDDVEEEVASVESSEKSLEDTVEDDTVDVISGTSDEESASHEFTPE